MNVTAFNLSNRRTPGYFVELLNRYYLPIIQICRLTQLNSIDLFRYVLDQLYGDPFTSLIKCQLKEDKRIKDIDVLISFAFFQFGGGEGVRVCREVLFVMSKHPKAFIRYKPALFEDHTGMLFQGGASVVGATLRRHITKASMIKGRHLSKEFIAFKGLVAKYGVSDYYHCVQEHFNLFAEYYEKYSTKIKK